jgi:undecaprenyl-diphosphatase
VGGKLFIAMALAFAVERPLYWALKNSFKRNRPPSAIPGYRSFIVPSDQFSFPSGHTSGAFVTATLLSAFYPSMAPLLYCWASLVAMSRVNLGVHFPSDTVAGAGMGYLMAWCALTWVN